MLERTKSGPNRLKAGVPAGWRFGHKTGTGQELAPVSTGYNDIGIMTAPDGTRYAVVVMIASTTSSIPARMAMMQAVSRAVAIHHR
jgi:beta-lactamase class A